MSADNQEASEIKEKNTLTSDDSDGIVKRYDDLSVKVNDFFLKRKEPLKDDPKFENIERLM